jgi:hypothetical protein
MNLIQNLPNEIIPLVGVRLGFAPLGIWNMNLIWKYIKAAYCYNVYGYSLCGLSFIHAMLVWQDKGKN